MNSAGVFPSVRTMCSIRRRPTPSAPVAAARSAASGMETFTFTSVAVIGLTGVCGRASSTGSNSSADSASSSAPRRTVPLSPSIVTSCPFSSSRVPVPVPTTAGTPSSRETMAAWLVMPPSSVMMPDARFIAGTMSGMVISVTRMSPS